MKNFDAKGNNYAATRMRLLVKLYHYINKQQLSSGFVVASVNEAPSKPHYHLNEIC
uniref:Uncharacterized protein n=1 Tax=Octopus bimaculoides TaxID=37653 RepID=A0A0L8HZ97_OCTBM